MEVALGVVLSLVLIIVVVVGIILVATEFEPERVVRRMKRKRRRKEKEPDPDPDPWLDLLEPLFLEDAWVGSCCEVGKMKHPSGVRIEWGVWYSMGGAPKATLYTDKGMRHDFDDATSKLIRKRFYSCEAVRVYNDIMECEWQGDLYRSNPDKVWYAIWEVVRNGPWKRERQSFQHPSGFAVRYSVWPNGDDGVGVEWVSPLHDERCAKWHLSRRHYSEILKWVRSMNLRATAESITESVSTYADTGAWPPGEDTGDDSWTYS